MATILVGYDTETAAVGEALSIFTESPNFPLYELALDPATCRQALRLLPGARAAVTPRDVPPAARAPDGGARRRGRAGDALHRRPNPAARARPGSGRE